MVWKMVVAKKSDEARKLRQELEALYRQIAMLYERLKERPSSHGQG
jgi:uncharacterized lipoprotein YehR (DUF1307 family)